MIASKMDNTERGQMDDICRFILVEDPFGLL
jgi:hypothetical protein